MVRKGQSEFVGEEWFGLWRRGKVTNNNDYSIFYLNVLSKTGFGKAGEISGKGWDE